MIDSKAHSIQIMERKNVYHNNIQPIRTYNMLISTIFAVSIFCRLCFTLLMKYNVALGLRCRLQSQQIRRFLLSFWFSSLFLSADLIMNSIESKVIYLWWTAGLKSRKWFNKIPHDARYNRQITTAMNNQLSHVYSMYEWSIALGDQVVLLRSGKFWFKSN